MIYTPQVNDNVRLNGGYTKGRIGIVRDVNSIQSRARVEWDLKSEGRKLRTLVAFKSISKYTNEPI